MLNQRSDKLELIRIAEAVALEKAIDKDLILSSMESGIEKAANLDLDLKIISRLQSIDQLEILTYIEC